jgi:hypothetical protein
MSPCLLGHHIGLNVQSHDRFLEKTAQENPGTFVSLPSATEIAPLGLEHELLKLFINDRLSLDFRALKTSKSIGVALAKKNRFF